MGAANQEILENIFKVKEHIPVFIGDFGDDPYCNVKMKMPYILKTQTLHFA